jgi:hypothetical protein
VTHVPVSSMNSNGSRLQLAYEGVVIQFDKNRRTIIIHKIPQKIGHNRIFANHIAQLIGHILLALSVCSVMSSHSASNSLVTRKPTITSTIFIMIAVLIAQ